MRLSLLRGLWVGGLLDSPTGAQKCAVADFLSRNLLSIRSLNTAHLAGPLRIKISNNAYQRFYQRVCLTSKILKRKLCASASAAFIAPLAASLARSCHGKTNAQVILEITK